MAEEPQNTDISGENTQNSKGKSIWRFVPVAIIAAGAAAFFALGGPRYLSFEALSEHRAQLIGFAESHAIGAVLAFMAAYVVVVAFSLPGAVWLTLAGGFVFGGALTGVYVVFAATVGASLIFLAARTAFADLFRDRVLARAGHAVAKMEAGFRENAFSYLLVLRLVPLFPFWLVNLAPALLGVKPGTYVAATFLGIVPGTFVYAYVGAGLGAVFEAGTTPDLGILFAPEVLIPLLGLAGLSLISILYQKTKGKRAAHDKT